jgi:hypothetical protein
MKMDEDMMPGGGQQDRLGVFYGLLVVVVEEIDHHTAPAEFLESREGFLDAPTQGGLMHPGPQAHVTRVGVLADGRKVEARAGASHIGVGPRHDTRL